MIQSTHQVSSLQDILESFLVNHNLLWNQITRFGFGGTNPRVEEEKAKWCPQSEKQRISLRNKYARDRLYVVTDDVTSTTSLDMGASRGTLVGVIKMQDPMGDATRWYVDNGVAQGFLPAQRLSPLPQAQAIGKQASIEPVKYDYPSTDLISMDSPEKETKPRSESSTLQSLLYSNLDEESNTGQTCSNAEDVSKARCLYRNVAYEVIHLILYFVGSSF